MRAAFRMFTVSAVEGRDMKRRSVSGRTASSAPTVRISSKSGFARPLRFSPTSFAGWNARTRRANSVPISPVPRQVTRAPWSEWMPPSSTRQSPSRMISVYSIWRRSSISETMTECSAMVVP